MLGRARRNTKHFRRFVIRHADEVTQFDQLRLVLMFDSELIERFIDREQLVVIGRRGEVHFLNVHALLTAAVSNRLFAASSVNQNAPHRFSSRTEEMRSAIPLLILVSSQAQPRFVNERGWLQSVAGSFIRHLRRRQSAQFVIDKGEQFIGGLGIAGPGAFENARDVAHALQGIKPRRRLN